ncbi:hypothetical protein V8C86DRAFT_3130291 [Haematococcus lacustris]
MLTAGSVAGSPVAKPRHRDACSLAASKAGGRPSPSRLFGALQCSADREEFSCNRNSDLGPLFFRAPPSLHSWDRLDSTNQTSAHRAPSGGDDCPPSPPSCPRLDQDDIVGSQGADILYAPRGHSWTLTDQPGIDLMQAGSEATTNLEQVYVILFGVGERESEGIYSLRAFGEEGLPQETIIVFESQEDASRYAGLLEATMDHCPAVCSIPPEGLRAFCLEHGYGCRLEPQGSLLIPPDFNVGVTDWERSMRLRDGRWAVLEAEPERGAAASSRGPQVTTTTTASAQPRHTLGLAGSGSSSSSGSLPSSPLPSAATPLARYHPSFSKEQMRAVKAQLERLLPQSDSEDEEDEEELVLRPGPHLPTPSAPAGLHRHPGASSGVLAAPGHTSLSEPHSSLSDQGYTSHNSRGLSVDRELPPPPLSTAAAWYRSEAAGEQLLPSSPHPEPEAQQHQQQQREVVERPNIGKPTDRVLGRVVTVDEFRTSRVSSIMNSPQPREEELDSSKPTRPEDWKPKPGQVQSAWSKRFEAPVSWPPIRLSCDPPSVRHLACHATDPDNSSRNSPGSSGSSSSSPLSLLPSRFNPAYLAIFAGFAALFALRNPYIFAVLTIAFIIPQNSTTTSLNSLVLFAYDTGIFMNFGEAVYCVRLLTWLSIVACLASFALFH